MLLVVWMTIVSVTVMWTFTRTICEDRVDGRSALRTQFNGLYDIADPGRTNDKANQLRVLLNEQAPELSKEDC